MQKKNISYETETEPETVVLHFDFNAGSIQNERPPSKDPATHLRPTSPGGQGSATGLTHSLGIPTINRQRSAQVLILR